MKDYRNNIGIRVRHGNNAIKLYNLIKSRSLDSYRFFRDNCMDTLSYEIFKNIDLFSDRTVARLIEDRFIAIAEYLDPSKDADTGAEIISLYIIGADESNRLYAVQSSRNLDEVNLNNLDTRTAMFLAGFNKEYSDAVKSGVESGDRIRIQGRLVMNVIKAFSSLNELIARMARGRTKMAILDYTYRVGYTVRDLVEEINNYLNDPETEAGNDVSYLISRLLTTVSYTLTLMFEASYRGELNKREAEAIYDDLRQLKERLRIDALDMIDNEGRDIKDLEKMLNKYNGYLDAYMRAIQAIGKLPSKLLKEHIPEFSKRASDLTIEYRMIKKLIKMTPSAFAEYIKIGLERRLDIPMDIEIKVPDIKDRYRVKDFLGFTKRQLYMYILRNYGEKIAEKVVEETARRLFEKEERARFKFGEYIVDMVCSDFSGLHILLRPQNIAVVNSDYGITTLYIDKPVELSFGFL